MVTDDTRRAQTDNFFNLPQALHIINSAGIVYHPFAERYIIKPQKIHADA